jgi:RNase H-fold protein (predicted Holliday junction resolvase)
MSNRFGDETILAIDPGSYGFGFVVAEGRKLIDRGMREAPGTRKNFQCIRKMQKLIDKYQPDLLVLDDITSEASRRHPRIRLLIRRLQKLAAAYRIKVGLIAKSEMHDYVTMGKRLNQRKLAEIVARLLPELTAYLPRDRKPWMSEDPRGRLFGAAAMALSIFLATGGMLVSSDADRRD